MREFLTSGTGIIGLVFTILGIVFTATGAGLAVFVRPPDIGVAFLFLGPGILAVGAAISAIRLATLRRRALLLETGLESIGDIISIRQNLFVRLNRQHPWIVRYRYEVSGREYHGCELMMDLPAGYVLGAKVPVVYDPAHVEVSVLRSDPNAETGYPQLY